MLVLQPSPESESHLRDNVQTSLVANSAPALLKGDGVDVAEAVAVVVAYSWESLVS